MKKLTFLSLLLYSFGILLLWKWTSPFYSLTRIDHVQLLTIYLIVSFSLVFYKVKKLFYWLFNVLFILVFFHRYFYDEKDFFDFYWILLFIRELVVNTSLLFKSEWNEISDKFTYFLIFISLITMIFFINFCLKRQKIYFLYFITVLYITVLDAFTDYKAMFTIVLMVSSGFIVMGIVTFHRINKENESIQSIFIKKWFIPLVLMITFSIISGIITPKSAPVWQFNDQFIPDSKLEQNENMDSTIKNNGKKKESLVGYSSDDSRLGGSILDNDAPVFQYVASNRIYWKMETKDTYTGKGWIVPKSSPIPFQVTDLLPLKTYPNSLQTIKETARISLFSGYKYNIILYPAGINRITDIQPINQKGNSFQVDRTIDQISYYDHKYNPINPYKLSVAYEVPKYNMTDLIKTNKFDPNSMTYEFYERYTQLPSDLPKRIKNLAEQITVGKTNWFEKAKSIEDYLQNSEFKYTQKNVSIPGPKIDYVDQFLFESKSGYCNNFSTSMAVMLRTLGIPTRWVKGFTGGDYIRKSDDELNKGVYLVTNNNAHTWVEVFLPNQGWVAFEPTKGYRNEPMIVYPKKNSVTATQKQDVTDEKPENKPTPNRLDGGKEHENSNKTNRFKKSQNENVLTFLNNFKPIIIFFELMIFVSVFLLVYLRKKWIPLYYLIKYRNTKDQDKFPDVYLLLLKQLERCGLKRKEWETLNHYAEYIDSIFFSNEMTQLTRYYEQYVYHQTGPNGDIAEKLRLWGNLMKKTSKLENYKQKYKDF